ncbi:hypothetical protein MCHI_001726 [Candidatus Magnetoovum chiemensis]|nr:hypothetical protein MCHI_001726 [Candidatus Magnetoovum chiemensis]
MRLNIKINSQRSINQSSKQPLSELSRQPSKQPLSAKSAIIISALSFTLMSGCVIDTTPKDNLMPVTQLQEDEPSYIVHSNEIVPNEMGKRFININSAATDMAEGLIKNVIPKLTNAYYNQYRSGISPILVTSFVNLNDLKKTSAFGRALSELLMSELQAKGYNIIEMRTGHYIDIVENDGEFILTRDTEKIAKSQSAVSVLAGTYTITDKNVILNGKLISLYDNHIISSWTNRIERTKEVDSILKPNTEPVNVYERTPVNTAPIK